MGEQGMGTTGTEKKEPLESKEERRVWEKRVEGGGGRREVEVFSREQEEREEEAEELEKELRKEAKKAEVKIKRVSQPRVAELPQPPRREDEKLGRDRRRTVMTPAVSTWKWVFVLVLLVLILVLGRRVAGLFLGRDEEVKVAEGRFEICTFEDRDADGSWDRQEKGLGWNLEYRVNQGGWQSYRTRAGRWFFWRRRGCGKKVKVGMGDTVEVRSLEREGWQQTTEIEKEAFQVGSEVVEVREVGWVRTTEAVAVETGDKEGKLVSTAAVLGAKKIDSGRTKFRVCKFDDVNGNGDWDTGEVGLAQSFRIKQGRKSSLLPYRTIDWGEGGCGAWRDVAVGTEVAVAEGGILSRSPDEFRFKVDSRESFRVVFSDTRVALARDSETGQFAVLDGPVWGGTVSLDGKSGSGETGEMVTVAGGTEEMAGEETLTAAQVATTSGAPAVSPKTGANEIWLLAFAMVGLVGLVLRVLVVV